MSTDATETPAENATPPDATGEPAPVTPPRVFELTDAQRELLKEHLDAGWTVKDRRRMPVRMKLGAPQLAQLGKEGAAIDESLHEKRQGKNARQAALIRERNERQGAIHSLSARLRSGVDEISKEMTIDQQAAYSQRVAALRQELDDFEASRKEEMRELKDELAELEAQQQAISKKIRDGHGNVVTDVIDLIDYEKGMVLTLRLDVGLLVARRALTEHERQLELFTIRDEFPPLDEHEYTLAISGRLLDASRNYASRVGIAFDAAKEAVRRMLPDEELPPEVPAKTDAGKAADAKLLDKVESKEGDADATDEVDSVDEPVQFAKVRVIEVGDSDYVIDEIVTAEVFEGRRQQFVANEMRPPVAVPHDDTLPTDADVAAEEAAADAERAEPDADATYDVVIEKLRPDAVVVKVIKAVANVRGIKVKDAKELLQVFPATVLEGADQAAADSLVQELNALGCSVSAVQLDDADADAEEPDADPEYVEYADEEPVDGIHKADDPTEAIGFGKRR